MNGGPSQACRVLIDTARRAGIHSASAYHHGDTAIDAVTAARVEQIVRYGHDAAADDLAGPHRLIAMGRGKLLAAMHQITHAADHATVAASDMTTGDPARLTPCERAALKRRLASAAALMVAAIDCLNRMEEHI